MRRFLPAALFVLGLLGATGAAEAAESRRFTWRDLLPRAMQKNPELAISVYTEMSPAGKKLPPPTPTQPIYYVLMDGGLVEEGDPVGGDKPPTPAGLAEQMRRVLAAGGLVAADATHPPSIVIRYFWGSYNRIAPIDPDVDFDFNDPAFMKNIRERALIVGGQAFATDFLRALGTRSGAYFSMQDARNEELIALASGDLYFVLAIAFAPDAAGKRVALWKTVIATDSNALTMRETLPALVSAGRDAFGRETEVALRHPRLYEGRVEIGEPVVKGVVPEPEKK